MCTTLYVALARPVYCASSRSVVRMCRVRRSTRSSSTVSWTTKSATSACPRFSDSVAAASPDAANTSSAARSASPDRSSTDISPLSMMAVAIRSRISSAPFGVAPPPRGVPTITVGFDPPGGVYFATFAAIRASHPPARSSSSSTAISVTRPRVDSNRRAPPRVACIAIASADLVLPCSDVRSTAMLATSCCTVVSAMARPCTCSTALRTASRSASSRVRPWPSASTATVSMSPKFFRGCSFCGGGESGCRPSSALGAPQPIATRSETPSLQRRT